MGNEELQSKKRAIELYDSGKINEFEVGNTDGLKQIHQFLFQDVFDFAGKTICSDTAVCRSGDLPVNCK